MALIALSRSGATLRGKLAMFLPRLPVIRVAAALVAAAAGVGGLAIGGELRIEHRLDRVNAEGRRDVARDGGGQ